MSELSNLDEIELSAEHQPTTFRKLKSARRTLLLVRARACEASMKAHATKAFYGRSGNTPSLPKFSWDKE